MQIAVCPGMHSVALTDGFVEQIKHCLILRGEHLPKFVVFPGDRFPVYSPKHVLDFLPSDVLVIAFSAGVVGAIAAAKLHQKNGSTVRAFLAIDGWGVPLEANFPIHRISHDFFTHQTSALLGAGLESFYAEPAIAHLSLWKSPQLASGYQLPNFTPTTAAHFITDRIIDYRG